MDTQNKELGQPAQISFSKVELAGEAAVKRQLSAPAPWLTEEGSPQQPPLATSPPAQLTPDQMAAQHTAQDRAAERHDGSAPTSVAA